ncbi:transcription elongation regulator [Podochytrium sp. JEL0797]|nr:transcription elongation regulator [Podochytrium sp. JEL0797]
MDPLTPQIDFNPKDKSHTAPRPIRHERHDPNAVAPKKRRPPPPPPVRPAPGLDAQSLWTHHVSPAGVPYVYNAATGESRWESVASSGAGAVAATENASGIVASADPIPASTANVETTHPTKDLPEDSLHAHASPSTLPLPPDQNAAVIPDEPPKERAIAMKKLPNSQWAIILTSLDHEYFLNLSTRETTWEMPDEIGELIGQIMAGAYDAEEDDAVMPDHDEQNNDSNDKDNFDELADDKEVVRVYGSSSAQQEALDKQMADFIRNRDLEERRIKEDLHRKRSGGAGADASHSADSGRGSDVKRVKLDPSSAAATGEEAPLTNAEKQSMFMDMLRELDISPFSTFEKESPNFDQDARFLQIPLPKTRKHYFEQYCKLRSVEVAQERATSTTKPPKEVFRELLEEAHPPGKSDWRRLQLASAYDDFSRKWKKDSRFTGVSDDRDRKALFKDFVARLKSGEGERKRVEKKKVEEGFFALLAEGKIISAESRWREVQKDIERDKRYEAVPTMIQREDLFRQYLKKLVLEGASNEAERKELERKAKEQESLREREESVRRQKADLDREVKRSQYKLQTGESVNLFRNLLIDTIKTHKITWEEARPHLTTDPRFTQIRLPEYEIAQLFTDHTTSLFQRRLTSFHTLITDRTSITTPFLEVSELLLNDPVTSRLDLSVDELSRHYAQFQHDRERTARDELGVCLRENGFLRFHVKSAVSNALVQAVDKKLKEAEEGDEWRLIGLDEIKAVLKEDKRYNDFECFAAERDRIVFSFVKGLIEEFRNEKGGARDSIIARNAGGLVERKL